jgi:hypothetical protein
MIWILLWQLNCTEDLDIIPFDGGDDLIMAIVMEVIATAFVSFKSGDDLRTSDFLAIAYNGLYEIADSNNLSLDDLTKSNWEKLKPGSERGSQWMEARQ